MDDFATLEELNKVQQVLDKFRYPYLLEFHLDKYWVMTLDSELKSGFYPDELEYWDDVREGIRLHGDFAMVNVQLSTGVWITKVLSMDKMLESDDS